MGYWQKTFADGSILKGTDEDVDKGLASWSKSKFENMIGASIEHNKKLIEIIGVGDFWQSDTYEVGLLSGKSELVSRKLQKKIAPYDLQYFLAHSPNSLRVSFVSNSIYGRYHQVNMAWFGRWFTLEYNLITNSMRYFISPGRL